MAAEKGNCRYLEKTERQEGMGMESDRICREELQTVAGNLLAELYDANDDFRHGRMSRDAFVQRVTTLKQARQRFQMEFQQGHRIMAAPTR